MNTARLTRVFRKLTKLRSRESGGLARLARSKVELSEGFNGRVRPAEFLPGDLEKIRGFSPWRSPEHERASWAGEEMSYPPSTALHIGRASLVGPILYVGELKEQVGSGVEPMLAPGQKLRISDPVTLNTTFSGSRWFGSFMRDDLALQTGDETPETRIRAAGAHFEQAAGYRELLGLEEPRLVRNARLDDLWMISEPVVSPRRAERYRLLRNRLRASVVAEGAPRPVYLRRGWRGELRVLQNEALVEKALADMGFNIIDPLAFRPHEVARRLVDTPLVVSVEGSQLAHGIYPMAEKGAFLVIQPPERFALPYKEVADCMEWRFGFVVGDPAASGFTVDVDRLIRLAESMLVTS